MMGFFSPIMIAIWRQMNIAGDDHIKLVVNLRKTNVVCSSHLEIHKILSLQMTGSEAIWEMKGTQKRMKGVSQVHRVMFWVYYI